MERMTIYYNRKDKELNEPGVSVCVPTFSRNYDPMKTLFCSKQQVYKKFELVPVDRVIVDCGARGFSWGR